MDLKQVNMLQNIQYIIVKKSTFGVFFVYLHCFFRHTVKLKNNYLIIRKHEPLPLDGVKFFEFFKN